MIFQVILMFQTVLLKWLSKSIVSRVTKKSNLLSNFLYIYVKVEIWEQEENLLCIVSYKQGKSSVYLYKSRSQTKYNMVMRNTKCTNKKSDLISKYRKSKFLQFSMAQYPHSNRRVIITLYHWYLHLATSCVIKDCQGLGGLSTQIWPF